MGGGSMNFVRLRKGGGGSMNDVRLREGGGGVNE